MKTERLEKLEKNYMKWAGIAFKEGDLQRRDLLCLMAGHTQEIIKCLNEDKEVPELRERVSYVTRNAKIKVWRENKNG